LKVSSTHFNSEEREDGFKDGKVLMPDKNISNYFQYN